MKKSILPSLVLPILFSLFVTTTGCTPAPNSAVSSDILQPNAFGQSELSEQSDYLQTNQRTGVSTFDQLKTEIEINNAESIIIEASFAFTEPIYVDYNCDIDAVANTILLRDASYTGDLFVLGEDRNGIRTFDKTRTARLRLHNLTIDGNSDVASNVDGSIFFLYNGTELYLGDGVTVQNCNKVGNVRSVVDNDYFILSYPERAGGSVAIINHAMMTIDGAVIKDCGVNTASTSGFSYNGGAIYNQGTLIMYDGEITGCSATSGGAIYNYATTFLYGGKIAGNTATTNGGAIALPNSQYANLYCMGAEISNNTAKNGGAFHQNLCAGILIGKDSVVKNNSATYGGAIYSYGSLIIKDSLIESNSATSHGGAIYQVDNLDEKYESYQARYCELRSGAIFKDNYTTHKTLGGAISVNKNGIVKIMGATFDGNHTKSAVNIAHIYADDTTKTAGTLYIYSINVVGADDYSSLITLRTSTTVDGLAGRLIDYTQTETEGL